MLQERYKFTCLCTELLWQLICMSPTQKSDYPDWLTEFTVVLSHFKEMPQEAY